MVKRKKAKEIVAVCQAGKDNYLIIAGDTPFHTFVYKNGQLIKRLTSICLKASMEDELPTLTLEYATERIKEMCLFYYPTSGEGLND